MGNADPKNWIFLGCEITATILGSALCGWWLSGFFQSQWPLVMFSISGVGIALWRMIRSLTRR